MELFLEKPLEPVAISWLHHVDAADLFTACCWGSYICKRALGRLYYGLRYEVRTEF
jgi:hypothetical protein